MKKLFNNLFNSFSTNEVGWSARKLSAFAAVCVATYVTIRLLPKEFMIDAIYAWLGFALICLGLIRIEQFIDLRYGKQPKQPTDPNN